MNKLFFVLLSVLFCLDFSYADDRGKEFMELSNCYKGVAMEGDILAYGAEPEVVVAKRGETEYPFKIQEELTDLRIKEEIVYITTLRGVEAWSTKTGKRVFRVNLPVTRTLSAPGGLALSEKELWVARGKHGVTVLDRMTGKQLRHFEVPGHVVDDIALEGRMVYLYSLSYQNRYGRLYQKFEVRDQARFRVRHEAFIDGSPSGQMVVEDDYVYLGTPFIWKMKKSKLLRKKFHGKYVSIYDPDPLIYGQWYMNDQAIYHCERESRDPIRFDRSERDF